MLDHLESYYFALEIPVDIPVSIGASSPATTVDPLPGALKDIGSAIADSRSKEDDARASMLSQVNTGLAYNPDSQALQRERLPLKQFSCC